MRYLQLSPPSLLFDDVTQHKTLPERIFAVPLDTEINGLWSHLRPPLTKGIQSCLLRMTVASFYLEELKYFKRKLANGWSRRTHSYFYKTFHDYGMTIVRFCIAALLGELRYLWQKNDGVDCETCEEEECMGCHEEEGYYIDWGGAQHYRYKAEAKLGCEIDLNSEPGSTLRNRETIYRQAIPEEIYCEVLEVCSEIFRAPIWERNIGGLQWAYCADDTLKLYHALCGLDTSMIIYRTDRVINRVHNNGLFLNKFDCNQQATLEATLTAHSIGNLAYLYTLAEAHCPLPGHANCHRYIGD